MTRKIHLVPPLFHNTNSIDDFKEKGELFNKHFSEQCLLIENRSTIPSVFTPLTHKSLLLFKFTANYINSIIKK